MISRIWHGWTSRENAAAYEELLKAEILPGIASRKIRGLQGAHLLRRDVPDGVESLAKSGANPILASEVVERIRQMALRLQRKQVPQLEPRE